MASASSEPNDENSADKNRETTTPTTKESELSCQSVARCVSQKVGNHQALFDCSSSFSLSVCVCVSLRITPFLSLPPFLSLHLTMGRTIFVTVGTTLFDALTEGVSQPEALTWMKKNGYTRLVVQYGKGTEPSFPESCPLETSCYDFRSSLDADMQQADLILSHAGAGTVMEALRMNKRLVVVINTLLMNNHQTELASAMAKRDHLFVVDKPEDLKQIELWNDFDSFCPIPYAGGDDGDFAMLLNQHMGLRGISSKGSSGAGTATDQKKNK